MLFIKKKLRIAAKFVIVTLFAAHCGKDAPQSRIATVAVSSVSLNKTTLNISVGATETLTATIIPENATNKTLVWKSSNSDIATVDDHGKIKALKVGATTITVTTNDHHKEASCALTVTQSDNHTPVSGITLNHYYIDLNIEAHLTEKLVATIAPANATNKAVTFSSSNSDIATVDADGNVIPIKPGQADITVTTADGSKKATCNIYVFAQGTLPAGPGYLDLIWTLSADGTLSFSQGIIIPNFGENGAPWFTYRELIKKLEINGIRDIGNYAFSRCTNMTNVSISQNGGINTETIGNYAFSGCTAIRDFPTPTTVKTISLGAFSGCTRLQTFDMHDKLTTIGDWAFANCIELQTILMPKGVKTIGIGGFNNCAKLRSLTIGSGITQIGEDAFRYCPALKTVSCYAVFPPALGARNFDATGDELKIPYNNIDLYRTNTVNAKAWRAAFDNNIIFL